MSVLLVRVLVALLVAIGGVLGVGSSSPAAAATYDYQREYFPGPAGTFAPSAGRDYVYVRVYGSSIGREVMATGFLRIKADGVWWTGWQCNNAEGRAEWVTRWQSSGGTGGGIKAVGTVNVPALELKAVNGLRWCGLYVESRSPFTLYDSGVEVFTPPADQLPAPTAAPSIPGPNTTPTTGPSPTPNPSGTPAPGASGTPETITEWCERSVGGFPMYYICEDGEEPEFCTWDPDGDGEAEVLDCNQEAEENPNLCTATFTNGPGGPQTFGFPIPAGGCVGQLGEVWKATVIHNYGSSTNYTNIGLSSSGCGAAYAFPNHPNAGTNVREFTVDLALCDPGASFTAHIYTYWGAGDTATVKMERLQAAPGTTPTPAPSSSGGTGPWYTPAPGQTCAPGAQYCQGDGGQAPDYGGGTGPGTSPDPSASGSLPGGPPGNGGLGQQTCKGLRDQITGHCAGGMWGPGELAWLPEGCPTQTEPKPGMVALLPLNPVRGPENALDVEGWLGLIWGTFVAFFTFILNAIASVWNALVNLVIPSECFGESIGAWIEHLGTRFPFSLIAQLVGGVDTTPSSVPADFSLVVAGQTVTVPLQWAAEGVAPFRPLLVSATWVFFGWNMLGWLFSIVGPDPRSRIDVNNNTYTSAQGSGRTF